MRKLILLTIASLLLVSCSSNNDKNSPSNSKDKGNQKSETVIRIDGKKNPYLNIHGFVFENLILLTRQNDTQFELVLRNLYTGEEKVIYSTVDTIIQVEPNEDGSLFAVHEATNSNTGLIKVVNRYGDLVWEKEYVSSEIQMYWNTYKVKELYVQYFQKDWTYQTDEIDIENKKTKEIEISQTFFEWVSKNKVAYINWNKDEPSLTGPLMVTNVDTDETETVLENAIAFHVDQDIWVTFQLIEEPKPQIEIRVASNKKKKVLFVHHQPITKTYSESFLIPYFDWSPSEEALYFFESMTDENNVNQTALYKGTKDGIKKIRTMDAAPINCDKNSAKCLIGFQFENLYDGKRNEWIPLLENGEK